MLTLPSRESPRTTISCRSGRRFSPILMEIPYDQLGGVHSLTAIITDGVIKANRPGGEW